MGIGFGVAFFFIIIVLAEQMRCGFAPLDMTGCEPAGHVIASAGADIAAAAARVTRLVTKCFTETPKDRDECEAGRLTPRAARVLAPRR